MSNTRPQLHEITPGLRVRLTEPVGGIASYVGNSREVIVEAGREGKVKGESTQHPRTFDLLFDNGAAGSIVAPFVDVAQFEIVDETVEP